MSALRRLIPSMFQRRILLLLAVFAIAMAALGTRVYWITVVRGDQLRAEAERILSTRQLIGTERGRILDRNGRILAEDRPSYDIAVDFDAITGEWAYDAARQQAYQDYRQTWGQLSVEQRDQLIAAYQQQTDARLERLWETMTRLGGIDREELERRKRTVIDRVQTIRLSVWRRRAERRAEELGGPVELSEVAIPVAEEREAHTLLAAVDDDVAFEFRRLAEELPGIEVVRSQMRHYPYRSMEVDLDRRRLPSPLRSGEPVRMSVESVATHLIGSMREVRAEDMHPDTGRPFNHPGGEVDLGGYLPGDMRGAGGAEAAEEHRLRGERGQRVIRRDTRQVVRQPHRPGRDAHLTIDIMLQARIRALMEPGFGLMSVQPWHANDNITVGTPLYGAALVLEVDTGELLAMVSTPAPPPRTPGEPYPDLFLHPDQPLFNKPIGVAYAPGSTLKPIVYAVAAAGGHVHPDEHIECLGHLIEGRPDRYRCWGWRPDEGQRLRHGPLGPVEAIARSCNIYFYEAGRRMGAPALVEQFQLWGLGRPAGLGLAGASHGIMPALDSPNSPGRELSTPNAIMLGIGQGPIAVPPVQVAAAHAALARGGYYLSPVLIRERAADQVDRDLHLPPHAVANALEGMEQSANATFGTSHNIVIDGEREPILDLDGPLAGITVRAKSGTAQAADQYELIRAGDSVIPNRDNLLRSGSHGWYVAHVHRPGETRAAYIIVVMAEYGGSGGRVAGPVAHQIIRALRAEGYL